MPLVFTLDADFSPALLVLPSPTSRCEESCRVEEQSPICAIYIDYKLSLRKKNGKGKQTTTTVTYANPCIGACNVRATASPL